MCAAAPPNLASQHQPCSCAALNLHLNRANRRLEGEWGKSPGDNLSTDSCGAGHRWSDREARGGHGAVSSRLGSNPDKYPTYEAHRGRAGPIYTVCAYRLRSHHRGQSQDEVRRGAIRLYVFASVSLFLLDQFCLASGVFFVMCSA